MRTFPLALAVMLWPLAAFALTLDECIGIALSDSPTLEAAAQRAASARHAITRARSAYWPQLKVGGQYARTDNPPQAFMISLNQRTLNMADPAFNPNEPDDTDNLRFSLGATWQVWDSGRRAMDVRQSRLAAEAQRHLARAARNDLVHAVTRAHYEVLQARAFLGVQGSGFGGYRRDHLVLL